MPPAMISGQTLRDSGDMDVDSCRISDLSDDERTMLIEIAAKVKSQPCRNQVVQKAKELIARRLVLAAHSDLETRR